MNNPTFPLLFEDCFHRVGTQESGLTTDERKRSSRCLSPGNEEDHSISYAMDGTANMS